MPTPPPSHSASSSTPAPRSQVNPNSPEITTRYSPCIVKRMQGDECFVCHQIGHWSYDCPLRRNSPSNSNKRLSSSPIYCCCGHGFCIVKISNSKMNPGRKYYSCPIERGKPCTKFVQFCDQLIDERYLQPPPYKYPECGCGAGVCGRENDCFTCPIEKGHGKCNYKVTEDKLLHSNKSMVPIQQSSQDQYDLVERGGLHLKQSKRMRMMDSFEIPLSLTISEILEGDNATTPEVTPSRRVGFAEFQVDDDLQEVVNSLPWDVVEREVMLCHQSARRASCRQNLFGNSSFPDAFADASFGIFPSFDLVVVPTQAITGDDHSECSKQLAITNISENDPPPPDGCHTEVSVDVLATINPAEAIAAMEAELEPQVNNTNVYEGVEYETNFQVPESEPPTPGAMGSASSQERKRKRSNRGSDGMEALVGTIDKLGNSYDKLNDRLNELISCFKHEKEGADRRMNVAALLKEIDGLTHLERNRAGRIITKDKYLTDYIWPLAPEDRVQLVFDVLHNEP